MIAVKKDWGLKNPGSQTEDGRLKSDVQPSSSLILKSKSAYQADKPFRESYAFFVQAGGTWEKYLKVLRQYAIVQNIYNLIKE